MKALATALGQAHSRDQVWNLQEDSITIGDENTVTIVGLIPAGSSPVPDRDSNLAAILKIDITTPEFLKENRNDVRGDIYAIGSLGFEMLTGKSPQSRDTVVKTMVARFKNEIEVPHAIRSDCPPELSRILIKAMATAPEDRYQSADQLLADLNGLHV